MVLLLWIFSVISSVTLLSSCSLALSEDGKSNTISVQKNLFSFLHYFELHFCVFYFFGQMNV